MNTPEILATTVGSYSPIDWVAALPSEQAVIDATSVVIGTQRRAGIDLPTDGELYRFDPNHPDTNGMIEYFVSRLGGIRSGAGRSEAESFRAKTEMGFRRKPAGVVVDAIGEGTLNLHDACARSASVAGGPFKFTLTSPYMLARTLLDRHYQDLEALTHAVADALADQVDDLPCACVQVDEAHVPGSPEHAPLALEGINRILDRVSVEKAVHFCFGNYGGQVIQRGDWGPLIGFLNGLHVDHLVLELAHRPASDLEALQAVDERIAIGVGVIDIKVNHVERPDEVAARIEKAVDVLGASRVRYVHPDCGFWMLKRSIAELLASSPSSLPKGGSTLAGSESSRNTRREGSGPDPSPRTRSLAGSAEPPRSQPTPWGRRLTTNPAEQPGNSTSARVSRFTGRARRITRDARKRSRSRKTLLSNEQALTPLIALNLTSGD